MVRGIVLAAACYGALLALANAGVGMRDSAPTVGTLIMATLLIVAPAGLALPAGQVLAAPLWAWATIISWAALGALFFLVDPSGLGRPLALFLLLPPLVGACASPALLLAAWRAPQRAAALRRCGYGVAAFPAGLLALAVLGALTPITALLFSLLFVAGSFLWYAASPAVASSEMAPEASPAPEHTATATPLEELRPVLRPVIALAGRGRSE
jgi:hypothetical protein